MHFSIQKSFTWLLQHSKVIPFDIAEQIEKKLFIPQTVKYEISQFHRFTVKGIF